MTENITPETVPATSRIKNFWNAHQSKIMTTALVATTSALVLTIVGPRRNQDVLELDGEIATDDPIVIFPSSEN